MGLEKGENMKTISIAIAIGFLLVLLMTAHVSAHCEIPCGIYHDELRANLIYEHTTTIEKSMKSILKLSKQSVVDYNQIARWVSNKEEHATKIQHIVSQYFMTQRIKPDTDKYTQKITLLHRMLISAMECKQTTDVAHIETLRSLLKDFEMLYFGRNLH